MEKPTKNTQLPVRSIDDLGHIIRVGRAQEDEADYNPKIEVFQVGGEDDADGRAQVYQMWAVDKFASNPVANEALHAFNLSGDADGKENWTQLLEHIAGVTANALHIEKMLEKYGVILDGQAIEAATLYDSLEKPMAVEEGTRMRMDEPLETATLVHDVEKPAELAVAREMKVDRNVAAGLENSRDNPVIREGRLWSYMQELGVENDIILAAQNTGRSDRFFSDLDDYSGDAVKKAIEDRERLASLIGVDREVVDAMSPAERRRASIEAKGPVAAIVGIADAVAAQFKFKGVSDAQLSAMAEYYKSRKTDPESQHFFGQDWPEYYKEVRRYLIDLVPEEKRAIFEADLDSLTYHDIFNDTVLPHTLGEHAMDQAAIKHETGEENIYDTLKYPEH